LLSPIGLVALCALQGCAGEAPLDLAPIVSAHALVADVSVRFATPTGAFGERAARTFTSDSRGGITLADVGVAPTRGTRALTTFPAKASDGLHVSAAGHPDAWLNVRPVSDQDATRAVVDGLVVYKDMVGGADAIYTVSDERTEEWLYLRDADQAAHLSFDIELGAGIAGLEVDGSGHRPRGRRSE